MSKIRVGLAATFLCLVMAVSVAGQKTRAPARDYFPLRVGDSWTYHNDDGDYQFTVKVLSEEKQADGTTLYLTEKLAGTEMQSWYSKAGGWVLVHREAYPKQEGLEVKHTPAKQYLKIPLVTGAKWTWRGKSIVGTDMVEVNEVIGPELLKVAAGRFRAIKVVSKISSQDGLMTTTNWYADGVGLIKTMTESGPTSYGWELVDYSFKKKSPKR